jgi:CBS domain containing-hemolysin-like protein
MADHLLTTSLLKLLAVLGLILLNAVFVAAEFAFVRLRDTQLEGLILKGHRRARIARHMVRNIEASISAIQLGITFCGLATGAMVQPVFRALLSPVFALLGVESMVARTTTELIVGFLVSTILLIVLGELVPKALAIRKTLPTALWVAQPLEWFCRLTFPLIWILNHLSQWFLRLLGIQPLSEFDVPHTEEELRLLVGAAQERAGATQLGRSIVLNALDLRRRIARDVMRPRQEIVALDSGADIAACLAVAEQSRYSRLPLCEGGNLDQTLGVIHIKDLYGLRSKAQRGADLLPAARKLIYVPETARLEKLLQLFLDRKLHMAIVVDEFGTTVGMVTLENILEEIVGQIQDEFDQEKPMLVRLGENAWEAAGTLPLHDLAELVGERLHESGLATVNGWVTQRLGGFPKAGDSLPLGRFVLRVEEMDGLRVARLNVTRSPEPAQPSPA